MSCGRKDVLGVGMDSWLMIQRWYWTTSIIVREKQQKGSKHGSSSSSKSGNLTITRPNWMEDYPTFIHDIVLLKRDASSWFLMKVLKVYHKINK